MSYEKVVDSFWVLVWAISARVFPLTREDLREVRANGDLNYIEFLKLNSVLNSIINNDDDDSTDLNAI